MSKGAIQNQSGKGNKPPAVIHDEKQTALNRVNLFYWTPRDGKINFGDFLSEIVVTKLLEAYGHSLEDERKASHRLLAIGSILHFARDHDVVWGSGVNGKKLSTDEYKFKSLDVRAVRGPLTRQFLMERGIEVPEVYGDPALLLPALFPSTFQVMRKHSHVIVPNLHDLKTLHSQKWRNFLLSPWRLSKWRIVSPLWDWHKCISKILEAELVIASSLHGLIVAEAYGIPARYVRLSETEGLFKYNDYMMGTGRGEIEYATSIGEALEMGGMEPPKFDNRKLLEAFPWDLWK